MPAADYHIAAIPEPYQILGLRLKPFCLGHFMLMSRFGCAFASDVAAAAEHSDLILACLICSRSYEDFLAFIDRPSTIPVNILKRPRWIWFLQRLLSKLFGLKYLTSKQETGWRDDVKAWGEQIGFEFDLAEKVALFNDYLERAFRQPVVIYEGETSTSGAHWSTVLKVALTGPLGYSQSEAMNLPLEQAFWEFYKNAENNGVVTIADAATAQAMREMDALSEAQEMEASHV